MAVTGWLIDQSTYVRMQTGRAVETAEKAGLTVLAVDRDFDLIADITGQPVETLALSAATAVVH